MRARPTLPLLVLAAGLIASALTPRPAHAQPRGLGPAQAAPSAGYLLGPVAGRSGQIPFYNPLRNSGHESGDFVFTRIKPAADYGPCDDSEAKAALYRTFLDNHKGSPEQQKMAHEAGRDYIARDESCPKESDKNVISFIGRWAAKYEAAVREWERVKGRQP